MYCNMYYLIPCVIYVLIRVVITHGKGWNWLCRLGIHKLVDVKCVDAYSEPGFYRDSVCIRHNCTKILLDATTYETTVLLCQEQDRKRDEKMHRKYLRRQSIARTKMRRLHPEVDIDSDYDGFEHDAGG